MKRFAVLLLALFTLTGCSGMGALNLITPRTGYTVEKDIAYGGTERQKLDIYIPADPAPGRPVLVFFYGGSWQNGSKGDYKFVGQGLAAKGLYTVIVNYRTYPEVYFPGFMHDAAAALVWTRKHIVEYHGSPNNIFVAGHSAGAYIAVLVAMDERYLAAAGGDVGWLRGVIGLAGPYDFLPFTSPKIKAVFSKVDPAETQPVNFVRPGLPPMLLATGNADTDVRPGNTRSLAAKLKESGDDVTERIYSGVTHKSIITALANGFHTKAPAMDDITAFVAKHTWHKPDAQNSK